MESLGAKLKNLREEKGYTLEQVARDTHITKRYIIAIEEERFDEFPAEPYLVGFLRSYCEFLEINAEEIVQLYRNMRLQEQPPPIDQLVAPRRRLSLRLIAGAIGAVVLLTGVIFLLFRLFFSANAERIDEPPTATTVETEYQFTDDFLEQRFRVGDTVIIPVNGEEFFVRVAAIEDDVVLDAAGSEQVVDGDREHGIDISDDGQADIIVLLRSVNGDSGEAVLRFDRRVASPSALMATRQGAADYEVGAESVQTAIGSTAVAARERESMVIGTYPSPDAYEVQVRFTGPTLFRYRVAGEQTNETFFAAGESLRRRFENRARIWSSNAGTTQLTVAGGEVELGGSGEVVAGAIRYTETDDGRYRLELIPAY